MQAIVINLKNANERRDFSIRQLERFDLGYVIQEATDKKEIDDEWVTDNISEPLLNSHFSGVRSAGLGALACADSHRKALEKMVGYSPYLVLEDDFFWLCTKSKTNRVFSKVENSSYDIVLLGYSLRKRVRKKLPILVRLGLKTEIVSYDCFEQTSGAYAYIVNPQCVNHFMKIKNPKISFEADDFKEINCLLNNQGYKVGCLFPPVIHSGLFESKLWENNKIKKSWVRYFFSALVTKVAVLQPICGFFMRLRLARNMIDS